MEVTRFTELLLVPVKSKVYIYLLLLNAISNLAYAHYGKSCFSIISMVSLAALSAYAETAIYKTLHWNWAKRSWMTFLVIAHSTFILVDYYLLFEFSMIIGQDVIDILAETNFVEIANFIGTYQSWPLVAFSVLLISFFNLLLYGLAKVLYKYAAYAWPSVICTCTGACIITICIYNYALYRNGMSIPQYHTATRLGYSLYVLNQRAQKIDAMRDLCLKVKAESVVEEQPSLIVIIGESFSVYHSSLFGYEKPTNPLLQERLNDGTLYVFDNVVSTACLTHAVMESVFFLDSLGTGGGNYPFPACFKAAGYKTALYDNQYFAGNGVTFLSDRNLSDILFDKRNTRRYQYDMDMVEDMDTLVSPSLTIIHLWGQHYTYSQRYPLSFSHFKESDYDTNRWKETQRSTIAHYDNATRYNDFVIDQIIRRFENKNCCVVYFSDHGEELFEARDYMGHGNAEHSPDLRYQIRVPLMVWLSPSFSRPEIKEVLSAACHIPVTTDDIPHLLLDMAGIMTDDFNPTRSFINKRYNKEKPRIVLHSINYDLI